MFGIGGQKDFKEKSQKKLSRSTMNLRTNTIKLKMRTSKLERNRKVFEGQKIRWIAISISWKGKRRNSRGYAVKQRSNEARLAAVSLRIESIKLSWHPHVSELGSIEYEII